MNYSSNFNKALETGKVVVRRVWKNENSTKDQYSVQFMQQIKGEQADPSRAIIALSQGISPFQLVTAIQSFAGSVIRSSLVGKHLDKDGSATFYDDEVVVFGKELLGIDLDIEVVENTTQNPMQPGQQAKINPSTGEVLTKDGKPIYRHTKLVPASENTRLEFIQHDSSVVDTSKVAAKNEMTENV